VEAVGINVGYLLIQLFCLFVIPALIIGGVVYWLIRRNSLNQDDLVANLPVTDEGIAIPKELLPNTKNLEVYQQKDKIILVPKSE
jgi:hypothetical protein